MRYIEFARMATADIAKKEFPMQAILIVTAVLHVLSGVFWAGATFVLARTGGYQADRFFRPQMGAATIAVLTGAILWFLLHRGPAGITEYILSIGAVCAVLAAGVQGASAPAVRQAAAGEAKEFMPSRRVAVSQRIAAGLLAITVACMAAARYA
jgi:hypothetical protein